MYGGGLQSSSVGEARLQPNPVMSEALFPDEIRHSGQHATSDRQRKRR
jgi:hypothetical protein